VAEEAEDVEDIGGAANLPVLRMRTEGGGGRMLKVGACRESCVVGRAAVKLAEVEKAGAKGPMGVGSSGARRPLRAPATTGENS
jgi:hypothetical protein